MGHQLVAARRGPAYRAEVALRGEFEHLAVRGRADGYDPERQRLEEIKTFRGDLAAQPANHRALHWAQAKVYGWLLCEAARAGGADAGAGVLRHRHAAGDGARRDARRRGAAARSSRRCASASWPGPSRSCAPRAARRARWPRWRFPHAGVPRRPARTGRSGLPAARRGRCLLAQAPTGIGKTVGTVFPLLKALPRAGARQAVLPHRQDLGPARWRWRRRRLLRAARRRCRCACWSWWRATRSASTRTRPATASPARWRSGFYDRLPAARAGRGRRRRAGPAPRCASVALAHQVCPYYLAQELARWSDVVVGDYNYYFDGSAMLHALTLANEWRVGVLVDEAHNLRRAGARHVQRAARPGRAARGAPRPRRRRCARRWTSCTARGTAARKAQAEPTACSTTLPRAFVAALQEAARALGDHFAKRRPATTAAAAASTSTCCSSAPGRVLRRALGVRRHAGAGGHGAGRDPRCASATWCRRPS